MDGQVNHERLRNVLRRDWVSNPNAKKYQLIDYNIQYAVRKPG
jgi:hypothetical protein